LLSSPLRTKPPWFHSSISILLSFIQLYELAVFHTAPVYRYKSFSARIWSRAFTKMISRGRFISPSSSIRRFNFRTTGFTVLEGSVLFNFSFLLHFVLMSSHVPTAVLPDNVPGIFASTGDHLKQLSLPLTPNVTTAERTCYH
jgi:hypothetical protein